MPGIHTTVVITGYRTGAAGAISVKYLARADAEKLCIIGAGSR
jgi:alanine dehydrogenase